MAAQPTIDISSSPAPTQSRPPPSSHRLATVSASEALQDLEDGLSGHIRTGLPSLDSALSGGLPAEKGGIERGKVTEIWGPSGSGTTAIVLHACVNALKAGENTVWVDCATPLATDRLHRLLASSGLEPQQGRSGQVKHISAATLSHLLALVLQPPSGLFFEETGLLVIDNVNTLVELDYPRAQSIGSSRTEAQKWQAGRRYAVLGALATALNKTAALKNLAVIVTTGCAMRTRPNSGLGGALAPGVGGAEWDAGLWNRLAVFRDFGCRFLGIQKCKGRSLISREEVGEPGQLIAFDINAHDGSSQERRPDHEANGTLPTVKPHSSPMKPRKRYIDEVADSEDEDEYGWDAGDEDVLNAGSLAATGSAPTG